MYLPCLPTYCTYLPHPHQRQTTPPTKKKTDAIVLLRHCCCYCCMVLAAVVTINFDTVQPTRYPNRNPSSCSFDPSPRLLSFPSSSHLSISLALPQFRQTQDTHQSVSGPPDCFCRDAQAIIAPSFPCPLLAARCSPTSSLSRSSP